MRTQLLFLCRHTEAIDDPWWRKAKTDPNILRIPVRGLEKNIPVIRAALAEYETLVGNIYSDQNIVAALKGEYISVYSSCKRRAVESAEKFREYLLKYYKTLWLEATQKTAAINGREYGFPWSCTEQGLRAISESEYELLLQDFFTYRPWGGESWVDVISRVLRFMQEVVMKSQKHMIIMTHHELIPIIEDLLLGLVPGPLTAQSGKQELPNATARVWVRDQQDGLWHPYKNPTITGRRGRDYSQEPDVVEHTAPPVWGGVTALDEYRKERKRRRSR